MSNIEELVKDILLNEISNDLAKKIAKALEINEHLTSTYELSVNVEDILSTDRNADPSNSGFYVKLEGTRSGVSFFYNNNLTIRRKPDSRKTRVVQRWNNIKGFSESFWHMWADKWLNNQEDHKSVNSDRGVVEVLQNKELYMKPTSFIVNNAMSRDVDRMFGDRIKSREVLEKNKIKYTIPYDGDLEYFLNRYKIKSLVEKIVKKSDGYYVTSEDGKKNLGGPYDNEDKAKKRLQQVHYFKDKKNEDYLKTDEDKLSVMSMEDIISELGYDGIVTYRDGKIEADWTTLNQLRRDALNEFDIDLGNIIDESLKESADSSEFGGELTYIEDQELISKFDDLYNKYENELNSKLNITLKGEPFGRYSRAWKKASIELDDKRKISIDLSYELPDGIYNYIYIMWYAKLTVAKGSGNLYGLHFSNHFETTDIGEGYHIAYKDGSDEKDEKLTIDELVNIIKSKYLNESLKEEKMDITDEVNAAYERITKKFPNISEEELEDRLYTAVANILSGYIFVDGDKSKNIDKIVNIFLKNRHNKVDESLKEDMANKTVIDFDFDIQPWGTWTKITLEDGSTLYGDVHIKFDNPSDHFGTLTTWKWDDIKNAIKQLLNKKYGYNVSFKDTLTDREIKNSTIDFKSEGLKENMRKTQLTEAPDRFGIPTDVEIKQDYFNRLRQATTDRKTSKDNFVKNLITSSPNFKRNLSEIQKAYKNNPDLADRSQNWHKYWGTKLGKGEWVIDYMPTLFKLFGAGKATLNVDTGDIKVKWYYGNPYDYYPSERKKYEKREDDFFDTATPEMFTLDGVADSINALNESLTPNVQGLVSEALVENETQKLFKITGRYEAYYSAKQNKPSWTRLDTFTVSADSKEEAARKFMREHPRYNIESVEEEIAEDVTGASWKDIYDEVKGKYHNKKDQLEGITKVLLTKGYKGRTFDSVEDALVTAMEMQEDMFGWYDPTIEEYDDILFSLSYLRDRKR